MMCQTRRMHDDRFDVKSWSSARLQRPKLALLWLSQGEVGDQLGNQGRVVELRAVAAVVEYSQLAAGELAVQAHRS